MSREQLDRVYAQVGTSSVESARPGDVAALVRDHGALLLAMARRLCRDEAEAEDLVQDTFERALRSANDGAPDAAALSRPRAWLVTILHHRFIDRCRRLSRQGVVVPFDPDGTAAPSNKPDEPEPAWHSITLEQVERAIDRLEDSFRAVYRLHALEGRSYTEIAAQLEIPIRTVGTRLYRARRKLKAALARELPRATTD